MRLAAPTRSGTGRSTACWWCRCRASTGRACGKPICPTSTASWTAPRSADLSTRIGRDGAGTTDAYLTIGAGTRAIAPEVDAAVAVEPDESYGGVPAAELLERRLGDVPDGIAYLGVGGAVDANDSSAYGAEVGTLGDELADAGVRRAVVANADAVEGFVSEDPPPEGAYARGAATALMGSDGIVPEGTVSRALLRDDPEAAVRLRGSTPTRSWPPFDGTWDDDERAVVLVEASDLSRVAAYGSRANADQRPALRDAALADADALLGSLFERVDPERDAVVVLSPVSPSVSPTLGMVAVQAPGVDGGLLESATTRRGGYVQLADVAPTVLTLLGEEPPSEMEGRTFQVTEASGDRTGALADAAEAAEFRDGSMVLAVTGIVLGLVLLTAATLLRERLGPWARALAGPAGVRRTGSRARHVPRRAGRRGARQPADPGAHRGRRRRGRGRGVRAGRPATAGVGRAGGHGVDRRAHRLRPPDRCAAAAQHDLRVLGRRRRALHRAGQPRLRRCSGRPRSCSPRVIVDRTGSRGVRAALGLMAAVVVVEGLPMLGADVGGVLAMVPAFGVTALLLLGRRIRVREVVGLVVATGVVLFAFALVDRGPAARGAAPTSPASPSRRSTGAGTRSRGTSGGAGRPASAGPSWRAGSPSVP